jgi:hypothetical protein
MGRYSPGTSGYRCPHCLSRYRQPGPRSFPPNQTGACLAGSSSRSDCRTQRGSQGRWRKLGEASAAATASLCAGPGRTAYCSGCERWMVRRNGPHMLRLWNDRCRRSRIRIFHKPTVYIYRPIRPVFDSRSRVNVRAGELRTLHPRACSDCSRLRIMFVH